MDADRGAGKEISLVQAFLSWKTLATAILAAIVFYAFFHGYKKEDIAQLGKHLRQVNPAVFALAFASYYLGYVSLGWRYKTLLANCGVRISLWQGIITCLMGAAANAALPTKLGDFYRARLLHKHSQVPVGEALGASTGERFLDLAFVFGLFFAVSRLLFGGNAQGPDAIVHQIIVASSYLLGMALLVLALLLVPASRRLLLAVLPGKTRLFALEFTHGVLGSLRRNWPLLILSTAGVWTAEVLRYYLVTLALGVSITIPQVVFIVMAATLLASIPISFSGLGFVEGGTTSLLKLFGLDAARGLPTILYDRLISFVSLIVLGFIAFLFVQDAS